MVGRVRLELTANGLKGRCSTIELPTHGRGGRSRTGESAFAEPHLATWLPRAIILFKDLFNDVMHNKALVLGAVQVDQLAFAQHFFFLVS